MRFVGILAARTGTGCGNERDNAGRACNVGGEDEADEEEDEEKDGEEDGEEDKEEEDEEEDEEDCEF